ncbi:MAG: hypothetical protein ABSC93_28515 [Bryobacteraceae bacterium]|jgi:hypothetical protein
MFSGVRGIDAGDAAEVSLGSGFSLVKPNDYVLSARTKSDMTGREWEDGAKVSRYLVYKNEHPFAPKTYEEVKNLFSCGLMALQVLKPVRTLGIVFYGEIHGNDGPDSRAVFSLQSVERRPPMEPWPCAWRKPFDKELIKRVPAVIECIQRIMQGPSAERRNAFILLQLGLECFHPLVAGLFWVMGLEAIFDSFGKEQFKNSLCACLGENTPVFPDWHSQRAADLTASKIAIDLYVLRSKVAHGADLRKAVSDSKYPVDLIEKRVLPASSDPVPYAFLLSEAACYLLCQVLRKELAKEVTPISSGPLPLPNRL